MSLKRKRVALVVAHRYADRQFWYPYYRLQEAGAAVVVLGPNGTQYSSRHGMPVRADNRLEEARATDYDAVLIPGGDEMARDPPPTLVALVTSLVASGRLVAAIGEGAGVLAAAGVVQDRRVTGAPAARPALEAAGGQWIEQEVVRDGHLITSRRPQDLPAFCRAITDTLT